MKKPPIIYLYARCSTCRKAVKWLETAGIAVEQRPIRETPPTKTELQRMLAYQGGQLKKLFNTSGGDYRAQQLGSRLAAMSVKEAIDLLHANGNLVKRPFLLTDDLGLVGFKEEVWAEALG